MHILPHATSLLAFVAARLVLAVTPGPAVLYIVTCSAGQGRRLGFASVAGIAAGNLGNAVAASFGLAALFAVSSAAFSIVKLCGAGYLLYLGIKALVASPPKTAGEPAADSKGMAAIFRQGFLVALLNPKTMIFFAAFLPQFVDSARFTLARTLLLSAIFVGVAASTDCLYALTAGTLGSRLAHSAPLAKLGRYANGLILIALGVIAALAPKPVLPKG